MKTRIKLLLGASLALPLIGFGPVLVFAQDADTSATTTTQPDDTSKGLSVKDREALQKRIQERKESTKTRLAAAEQQRLAARCTNAQGKVSSLHGRIKGIETSHEQVYGGLVSRLDELSGKLSKASVDTAQLDTQIAELKTKIETFKTDLADYKAAVADVKDMDCKADTTGFKASLDAARTELETLRKDAADIRAYIKDTIKPTLQTIRQQMETSSTDDDTTSTDSDTTTDQTTAGGGTQ